jgi:hypothetical protein
MLAAKIGRLYPFLSGNFSLVNSKQFKRFVPSSNQVRWCPSPGGPILVPLDDEVGRCIFLTGDYDRKITRIRHSRIIASSSDCHVIGCPFHPRTLSNA